MIGTPRARAPIRVLYYTDGHELGGAELHLVQLVLHLSGDFAPMVVVAHTAVREALRDLLPAVQVHALPVIRT